MLISLNSTNFQFLFSPHIIFSVSVYLIFIIFLTFPHHGFVNHFLLIIVIILTTIFIFLLHFTNFFYFISFSIFSLVLLTNFYQTSSLIFFTVLIYFFTMQVWLISQKLSILRPIIPSYSFLIFYYDLDYLYE
jgi:hypothetical protein